MKAMRIAILGFAGQGQSSYEYWNTPDNEITICDQNHELTVPAGVNTQLGDKYLQNLDAFDLIVRTPILHPRDIVAANPESPSILDKVTSNTNEFFRACPSRNIIGVTGTKGKGTTSTLITRILEAAGKRVHLGGNIGIPPLELLKDDIQPDDWVVLELANFQLIDLKYSPPLAVCLMVTPEHLDWHEDMEEYIAAKQQLFIHQKSDNAAIYYAKNEISESIADASEGTLLPYFAKPGAIVEHDSIVIDGQTICKTDELKLLGKHNWQNVCAAVTATWQITQDVSAIRQAVTSFSGLEHRLELVRELDGVRYYDDSFGTTPDTAIVAIQSFDQPKVLILGGSDKGVRFDELAKTVAHENIRSVITIGQMGPVIAEALRTSGFNRIVNGESSMDEIVVQAKNIAESGDVVLLSTACASFDMFKNYKDRGEQFTQAVQALA